MSAFFGAFRLLGRHSPKVFKTVIFATCGTAVAAFSFPFASQSLEAESHLYTANWYKLPTSGPVPPPRAGHSITAVGDKIVLLGGADKDGLLLLCDAHVLDTNTNTWRPLELQNAPNHASVNHAAVALNESQLLVIGGAGGRRRLNSAVYKLDLQSGAWLRPQVSGHGPTGLFGAGFTMVPSQNVVAMFGGYTIRGASGQLSLLDTESMAWRPVNQKGTAPCARVGCTLAAQGSRLYLFGGYDLEQKKPLNDLHVFDMETMEWTEMHPGGQVPVSRSGHACAFLDDKMYIVGGVLSDKALNDVYCYDPATNTWGQVHNQGAVPSERLSHASTVVSNALYIHGGSNFDGKVHDDGIFVMKPE